MEYLLTLGLVNAASATVLAILVAGAGRLLVRRPAALHCLWMVVLLKLVTPPLFEVPILGRNPVISTDEPVMVLFEPLAAASEDLPVSAALEEVPDKPAEAEPFWPRWRSTIIPWLGMAWLSGSAATLLLAAVRVHRFHRVLRQAYPAPDHVQDQVSALSERLGLRRPPDTLWIDATLMPMLWAVACRPRLIIPRDLWKSLSQRQQSLLLAHELAHLRRGDHVTRLFELVVTALYWWLPVLWWGRHALRDAEEECCDAWVVWAFPEEARTYAETLLDTVDFLNPTRVTEPLLASGFGRAHHLRRRLTMIMLGTTPRRLGWASALGTLALSAVLLPLTPSWGQKPPETIQATAFALELNDEEPTKASDPTKSEVRFVITTDGKVAHVQADSLDNVIELIKQKIEVLGKSSGDAEKHAAEIKALSAAVAELAKEKAKVSSSEGSKGPATAEARKLYIKSLAGDAASELTAEKKAQIDKAKARIDILRKQLDEKRQELNKAQAELKQLVASNARWEVRFPNQKVSSDHPARFEALTIDHRGPESIVLDHPKSATTLNPSDKDRLESLEKKLSKLLDEVASLKKHDKGN